MNVVSKVQYPELSVYVDFVRIKCNLGLLLETLFFCELSGFVIEYQSKPGTHKVDEEIVKTQQYTKLKVTVKSQQFWGVGSTVERVADPAAVFFVDHHGYLVISVPSKEAKRFLQSFFNYRATASSLFIETKAAQENKTYLASKCIGVDLSAPRNKVTRFDLKNEYTERLLPTKWSFQEKIDYIQDLLNLFSTEFKRDIPGGLTWGVDDGPGNRTLYYSTHHLRTKPKNLRRKNLLGRFVLESEEKNERVTFYHEFEVKHLAQNTFFDAKKNAASDLRMFLKLQLDATTRFKKRMKLFNLQNTLAKEVSTDLERLSQDLETELLKLNLLAVNTAFERWSKMFSCADLNMTISQQLVYRLVVIGQVKAEYTVKHLNSFYNTEEPLLFYFQKIRQLTKRSLTVENFQSVCIIPIFSKLQLTKSGFLKVELNDYYYKMLEPLKQWLGLQKTQKLSETQMKKFCFALHLLLMLFENRGRIKVQFAQYVPKTNQAAQRKYLRRLHRALVLLEDQNLIHRIYMRRGKPVNKMTRTEFRLSVRKKTLSLRLVNVEVFQEFNQV